MSKFILASFPVPVNLAPAPAKPATGKPFVCADCRATVMDRISTIIFGMNSLDREFIPFYS
jgi:hypothetical protein